MTVLVFNMAGQSQAVSGWEARDEPNGIWVWGCAGGTACRLDIAFDEFLALLAEGGKIVDVRHLQETK